MAKKKSAPVESSNDESVLNQLATKAGTVAGELIVAKNNIAEKVGDAVDTVKAKVQSVTGGKKNSPKKAVKKAAKAVVKKAAPAKKAVKKAAKKIAKKVTKKVAAAKRTVKKAARKAVKKVAARRR